MRFWPWMGFHWLAPDLGECWARAFAEAGSGSSGEGVWLVSCNAVHGRNGRDCDGGEEMLTCATGYLGVKIPSCRQQTASTLMEGEWQRPLVEMSTAVSIYVFDGSVPFLTA
ncbi:hypothetical protein LIA77_03725 [Sarocladium implicatum]|nr:hypothetical protein LIA77_03725 [Sarocladium implicatum]